MVEEGGVVVVVVGEVSGDFGDLGVSFAATVAGRYTRRGGLRFSVASPHL